MTGNALIEQMFSGLPPKADILMATLAALRFGHRGRNSVERLFNKIKQCHRVATRYDGLAANYLAFIQLSSISVWLRVNELAP